MTRAEELMIKNVVTVEPNCKVVDAVKIMKEKHIGGVIVRENQKLMGIFTERDILNKYFDAAQKEDMNEITVREIMTGNLITAGPNQSCNDIVKIMKGKKIRHMPVVEGDKLLGILSIRDLMEQYTRDVEGINNDLIKTTVSKDLVDNIIKSISQLLIVSDIDGYIIRVNKKTEEMLGYYEAELIGKSIDVIFENGGEMRKQLLESKDSKDETVDCEANYKTKQGQAMPAKVSRSVMLNNNGKQTGYIYISNTK